MGSTDLPWPDAVNGLAAGEGQLRATIQIKRKATGEVETHELVFSSLTDDQQASTQQQEP